MITIHNKIMTDMKKDKDNTGILQLLLDRLGIDYTNSYLNKLQNETPYIHSLWGIKTVLKLFGVPTVGVLVADKFELQDQSFPFIANTNKGLCVVLGVNAGKVEYGYSPENIIRCASIDFCEEWDGKALLPL